MSTLLAPRRFTVREYLRLAETGILRPDERLELIDGQILAMSPQGPLHSAWVAHVLPHLLEWFPRERYCIRPQSTLPLSDDFCPEPDVAVVAGPCEDHQQDYPTQVVLVVEVSHTSLPFDRGRKAQLYAASGVPDYWIVNAVERVVEMHREPSPQGYKLIRRLAADDLLLPLLLEPSGSARRVSEFLPA